jgi:NADPH-dependent F420 reductase
LLRFPGDILGKNAVAVLGFIGGTGPEGMGLALRWAAAGHTVLIGSRDPSRAAEKATELQPQVEAPVRGAGNENVALEADIVFICVPFSAHATTIAALEPLLRGKIVVDVVVPLVFEKGKGVFPVAVEEGSAAQQAQALLPESTVVSGFQNLAAESLLELEHHLDGDAIISADDAEARERVIALANELGGIRGINGGPLRNAAIVEPITVLQIQLNRIYRTRTHVKILGIPD